MKTLRVTTHWTTEQAEDMSMLLDDLKSAIWQRYGEEIVTMHRDMTFEQKKEKEKEKGENGGLKDDPLF